MDIDPTNQPRTLVEMIEEEFSFLESRGFQVTVEGENSVKYANASGVFVRVFRDPNDKYVGFRVGLATRPKDALTATELGRLAGGASPRGEYPERSDQVHASVARVAHQLRTLGERPLSGEEAIFDEAMELRRAYTHTFTRGGSMDPSSGSEG
jgi:hypothetical protein